MNQFRETKYAPDKIQTSMFLPKMKKALMGGIGADGKTSLL